MDLWLTERETDHLHVRCRVNAVIHRERSRFQDIAIVDTPELGRMLVLDGIVQTTLRDEFIYHEMLAHVPLFAHPEPARVLVIGGGDGGTVREILRHAPVRAVHLVEIDQRVVEVCCRYLPELSGDLTDPRVEVRIGDGIEYVKQHPGQYDVILVDSSDPLGPAEGLFNAAFYRNAALALRPGGLFVAQTESPLFSARLVRDVFASIEEAFGQAAMYLANVPIYSLGPWSFTVGTLGPDPSEPCRLAADVPFPTRYYTPGVHRAAFALPRYVQDLLRAAQPDVAV